jgi:hypothetical protein
VYRYIKTCKKFCNVFGGYDLKHILAYTKGKNFKTVNLLHGRTPRNDGEI